MKREKYLELFRKFIKGEININGIILIPQLWNINNRIPFQVLNPDKISYTKPALIGHLQEIFNEFHSVIKHYFESEYGDFELSGNEMFINKDLFKQIQEKLNAITELNLGDVKLLVTHRKFEINIIGEGEIEIINYVKPTSCEFKDVEDAYLEADVNYCVVGYRIMQKNSRFDEHEFNYMSIDDLMDNYPNFIDGEWQLYYVKTKFIL